MQSHFCFPFSWISDFSVEVCHLGCLFVDMITVCLCACFTFPVCFLISILVCYFNFFILKDCVLDIWFLVLVFILLSK